MRARFAARALWAYLAIALFASVALFSRTSAAHELKPAVLALREVEPGRFTFAWHAPIGRRDLPIAIEPRYPAHCQVLPGILDCGSRGLNGELGFAGVEDSVYRVIAQIVWLDGSSRTEVMSEDRPSVQLHGVTSDAGAGELSALAGAYARLGVEHILTGFDHLLFVLGLLLLVGQGRRLILTITAFTLAHSVTLAAGVLGLVSPPRAAVEAVIALSILLVAVECMKPGPSLTRRAPWAVAFGFGLLHGFGFAGALEEIGLPPGQVPLALVSFNVGVELGQLAVIAVAFLVVKLAGTRAPSLRKLETPLVYVMGTAAAFWTIERLSGLLAGA
jgi:hydrogenase/urease accessory protein HupE